jgi:hypothetical protein
MKMDRLDSLLLKGILFLGLGLMLYGWFNMTKIEWAWQQKITQDAFIQEFRETRNNIQQLDKRLSVVEKPEQAQEKESDY